MAPLSFYCSRYTLQDQRPSPDKTKNVRRKFMRRRKSSVPFSKVLLSLLLLTNSFYLKLLSITLSTITNNVGYLSEEKKMS